MLLDEINCFCGYARITAAGIAAFIRSEKPAWLPLILTGPGAPAEAIEVANTEVDIKNLIAGHISAF